jgi:uncharacterized protein DUF2130
VSDLLFSSVWHRRISAFGSNPTRSAAFGSPPPDGPRFRHRIEAIVEKFSDMREDLEKERKVTLKLWAKREGQIRGVIEATAGMYGDLQGIAGKIAAWQHRTSKPDRSTRHRLSHRASAPDVIYACWFVFRLCCLPLFAHWEHLTAAYADV